MTKRGRTQDWGFPRWRGYGTGKETQAMRMCDRVGCGEPGTCPAPKAPNSPERWMFCTDHAAEYNKGWDYFAGLSAEEAAERAQNDAREQSGYRQSTHYQWGGPGDGSRSRDEMHALSVLGLDSDAEFEEIKSSWRTLAKENHPDLKPGDSSAAVRFQSVQAAYEVLRQAEERRVQAK